MYYSQSEHNPPHIHAIYGEDMVVVDIRSRKILEGEFPPKALSMVKEWVEMNEVALMEIWSTQRFKMLPPLK